jgi:serine/threonine-protein phosphatase CPPED1
VSEVIGQLLRGERPTGGACSQSPERRAALPSDPVFRLASPGAGALRRGVLPGHRTRGTVLSVSLAWVIASLSGCLLLCAQPFDFVQMCDPQIGIADYADELSRLRDAVNQINELHPDLVLVCGDLVEEPKQKSFADFLSATAGFKLPCYLAAGNHDVGNAPTIQSLEFYRKSVGKDYYAFEHKGCTFVIANTQLWKASVPGESEQHQAWFEQTLAAAAAKGQRIFVAGHIPPFAATPDEPDGHDNLPQARRRQVLALCQRYGVRAFLAGHTHRTLVKEYHGMQVVTSETTSVNVDFHLYGFRVWHIDDTRPYRHEFVMLRIQPKK